MASPGELGNKVIIKNSKKYFLPLIYSTRSKRKKYVVVRLFEKRLFLWDSTNSEFNWTCAGMVRNEFFLILTKFGKTYPVIFTLPVMFNQMRLTCKIFIIKNLSLLVT